MNIATLSKAFKFDYSNFISNQLNEENFIDYLPIVSEIIKSTKSTDIDLKLNCDKILHLCLVKIFEIDDEKSLINYIELASQHCSSLMQDQLVRVYLFYLIKIIQNNNNIHVNHVDDHKENQYFKHQLVSFGVRQINFLNNYLNYLFFNHFKSSDPTVKSLIDFCLKALEVLDENDQQLSNLCINTLSKLAGSNNEIKVHVLSAYFSQLKLNYLLSLNEKKRLESFRQDTSLTVLTSLADYLMPINATSDSADSVHLNSSEYWRLIQMGLSYSNSLTRKRALYLLKRTTDYARTHKLVEKSDYHVIYNNNEKVHLYDGSLNNEWNDYFINIEILEETSVHIIKPALAKADNLIESVKKFKMHYSWLLALFNRAFMHESKFVVRWSVQTFLQSNFHLLINHQQTSSHDEAQVSLIYDLTQFIYGPLMLILQKAYLFYRTEEGETFSDNCPRIGKYLCEFLNSFVKCLPTNELKHQFIEQLTSLICGYTWNSISLLFICKSLRDLSLDSFNLNVVCIRNLCQILKCSLTTHEPFIRSAIQTILLQTLLKHSKISNSEEFQHFLDAINIISVKECIKYRNTSWFELVNWFNNESNKNYNCLKYLDTEFNQFIELETNTDEFSIQNRSIKLAKLILILTDLTNKNVKSIDLILDKLTNCNRNLYMSSERIEKCLFIFNFMISFANNNKIVDYLYDNCAGHILDYLLRRLNEANLTFKKINIYTDILDNIIQFKDSALINDKIIKQFLPSIELNLQEVNNLGNFSIEWKRFIFLNIYTSLLRSNISKSKLFIDFSIKNQQKFLSLKPLNKSFTNKLNKDVSELIINDLIEQYSIFNGQYLEKIWQSNEFLLQHDSNIDLIATYEQSLELASPHCLASLVKCSKSFNPSKYVLNLVDLFNLIYQLIWDIREDVKNFNDSFQAFLDCLINKEMLKANNSYLAATILSLIDKSPEKACIIRMLTNKTLELLSSLNSEQNQLFIDILIRLLIFGDIFKKEKKHMKEIEIYIESFGESFGTNQLLKAEYLNDSSVRISTLNYILNSNHLNSIFLSSFIEKLIHKDKQIADSNQKLFINSLVHRERFRLWQVILVILPKLNKNDYSLIIECAGNHLISENQPSMRIIIEWTVIKILAYQIETFDLFSLFINLENFSHKKIGQMCSWLNVLTHLIFIIDDCELKCNYFTSLIPLILSQILSSNFHVRTYVEAILIKIYTNLNDSKRNEQFLKNEKVKIILDQIYPIIHTIIDDKERHSSIILKHFYFQFDPIDDYSLDTIFNVFPFKSGIIEDELVTADQFLSIVLNKSIFSLKQTDYELNWLIKLKNSNQNLNQCTSGIWRFIAYRDDVKNGENLSIEDLQKKIIPWQNLMPNHEDLKETRSNGNLVLIASLIDKQTNLGGICRTCEIFNVKELVVSSLKHLEDKEFQSLAVTADKWLNIKEVTVKYLKKFLFEMKLQGYTLIGLEQTAKSVQLNKFEFPIKSLILLGNEKEGIPVDLIQMLEYCVEIPQLGVIRSLNVHVSCAICVWEYSKQNLIEN